MSVLDLRHVNRSAGIDAEGQFFYTEVYTVKTTSRYNDTWDAIYAWCVANPAPSGGGLNFPAWGDAYQYDNGAFATSYSMTVQPGKESQAVVTVQFTAWPENRNVGNQLTSRDNPIPSPAQANDIAHIEHFTLSEIVHEDDQGVILENKAHGPLEDLVTKEVNYMLYEVHRNVTNRGQAVIDNLAYSGRTNSVVWGTPSNELPVDAALYLPALISGPRISHHNSGTTYYVITYRFLIKDGGWDVKVPNRGQKYLSSNTLYTATDGNDAPVSEPVNLDGSTGDRLADNAVGNLLTFKVRGQADWTGLNITNPKEL